jgi:hypothetical protein
MSRSFSARGLLLLALTCPGAVLAAEESASVTGTWAGFVQVRPAEYEVDLQLKIEREKDGSLKGWISYPSEGIKDQALEKIATGKAGEVTFLAKDDKGVESAYQGWLSDDGRQMDGDLAESGQHFNFKLARGDGRWLHSASELKALSPAGTELLSAFNEDRGRVRLLLILSPTCPMCLSSAGVVQRYVLDAIQDADLRVYVVWEAIGAGDDKAKAQAASTLISDSRVRQFWSPDRFAGKVFQGAVGIKDSPAWDVFLLFATGKSWSPGTAPAVDSFMHNLFGHAELPKERHLNGTVLAREVQAQLAKDKATAASRP